MLIIHQSYLIFGNYDTKNNLTLKVIHKCALRNLEVEFDNVDSKCLNLNAVQNNSFYEYTLQLDNTEKAAKIKNIIDENIKSAKYEEFSLFESYLESLTNNKITKLI